MGNILLDTHIFIWWLSDHRRLSKKARDVITEADAVHISSASIWEAAIKIKLGKLQVAINDLVEAITQEGFIELPLTVRHAAKVAELPWHHQDPFDRVLVAQAILEPLHLLTADEALTAYSELVWLV